MPAPADLSLIIPAHSAGPMLAACLDSVAKLDPPPREVIVAIDGNDEQVTPEVKSRSFRVIACPSAPGVSATRNAGVAAATGEIVMLFPLLLALVVSGFRRQSGLLFFVALLLAFICYAEPDTIVGLANSSAPIRWAIFAWPLVAIAVLTLHTRPRHTA